MRTDEMIFYRNMLDGHLFNNMSILAGESNCENAQSLYYEVLGNLYKYAENNGFKGNLWHCFLTELLVYNENPYTRASELRGTVNGTLSSAVIHDLALFYEAFHYDIRKICVKYGQEQDYIMLSEFEPYGGEAVKYNKNITAKINELAVNLYEAKDVHVFKALLDEFYGTYGVGVFGLHKAFRVEHDKDILHINPIYNIAITSFDDIIGYDEPKQTLIDNTESFLMGKKANNCLIFGDAGTGKSSSIRALLNTYYDKGLRMIEVYKHQYKELNELIDRLKVRNYKFIIYMDDLSFEEFETEYKYLKAVIEGGLESKPENVLIYATSNRRHLVKETFKDKDGEGGDIHKNETVQEKLSLFARFGVSIYFGRPEKSEYDRIVKELAARYNLPISEEELLLKANMWELSHGGRSGRTARQFINDLRCQLL